MDFSNFPITYRGRKFGRAVAMGRSRKTKPQKAVMFEQRKLITLVDANHFQNSQTPPG
jgi:nucleoid DNA-binding protein